MRQSIFHIDWWLFIPVVVLVALSFSTLFSIDSRLLWNQSVSLAVSFIAFLVFSHINYQGLRRMGMKLYVLSLVLLVLVLVFGTESRGAVRWVSFFGMQIQFSEVLKPFLIFSLASFISQDEQRSFRTFLLTIFFIAPVVFLIYLQPDLGNAIIYVLVVLLTLLVSGFRLICFGLILLPFFLTAPFLWGFLHEYQKQRFLTFLYPTKDPLGTSYNIVQAIIAVGSGALFGKGISEGTQSGLRFLPERHTDFMFATLSESLGFFGSGIILLCFAVILFRIFHIFSHTDDTFDKIFVACSFFLILTEIFINISMNLGILPVVGITLPFVSYGGSSLVTNFILIGMLTSLSFSIRRREILEIR